VPSSRRRWRATAQRVRHSRWCARSARTGGLAGAAGAAAALRLPVLLDGYAVGAAAIAAARHDPLAGGGMIATHRSAEPGHDLVLTELALEPLLDLRLRLGEASGALLALPLIKAAPGRVALTQGATSRSAIAAMPRSIAASLRSPKPSTSSGG